jgi:hypothetical protein
METPDAVKRTLYTTPERDRFFLIADDVELPAGGFVIHTTKRQEHRVDPEFVAAFEIPRQRAEELLKEEMRSALRQFGRSVRGIAADAPEPPTKPTATPALVRELFSLDLGTLLSDPDALTTALRNGLTVLDAILASAEDPTPTKPYNAQLIVLQSVLERAGYNADQIAVLPARLREFAATPAGLAQLQAARAQLQTLLNPPESREL